MSITIASQHASGGTMTLDRIAVYWIKVAEGTSESKPTGGELEMTSELKNIFEGSFLGEEKGGPKRQPFHFNFGGSIRVNTARDKVLRLLEDPNNEIESNAYDLADDLQGVIDDRIGDLLLAIGLGWTDEKKRCVMWVFPSDTPIQLRSDHGRPTLREIKHAFTRKSKYRKAIYFEGPLEVSRSDFLWGELVDATRQGKSRSVAHYWVEKFLHGYIALSASQGVRHLVRGIRNAQKAASSTEEKASVVSAYSRLISGALTSTTLSQFSGMFVGESKKAYVNAIPKTIERDAVFDVAANEVLRQIKRIVYVLEDGVTIMFPLGRSIDPDDYITNSAEGRILSVSGIIESERIE